MFTCVPAYTIGLLFNDHVRTRSKSATVPEKTLREDMPRAKNSDSSTRRQNAPAKQRDSQSNSSATIHGTLRVPPELLDLIISNVAGRLRNLVQELRLDGQFHRSPEIIPKLLALASSQQLLVGLHRIHSLSLRHGSYFNWTDSFAVRQSRCCDFAMRGAFCLRHPEYTNVGRGQEVISKVCNRAPISSFEYEDEEEKEEEEEEEEDEDEIGHEHNVEMARHTAVHLHCCGVLQSSKVFSTFKAHTLRLDLPQFDMTDRVPTSGLCANFARAFLPFRLAQYD
ncbi:hypothetical protein BDZ89DRAFT_1113995 [Hymenopellis radicata]|nr:hypothetical protein BDZ89DRAFT_1113995 [Hymenopellis radicata]